MNKTQLLIGSLASDLFRVVNLTAAKSPKSAQRFSKEAKRWSVPLQTKNVRGYIKNIAKDISENNANVITDALAEKYLMYAVLLQNYSLYLIKNSNK